MDAQDGRCPRCRGRRYAFESVRALGIYRGPLRDVVLRMKRPQHETLTLAVGRLVAEKLAGDADAADLIVPVPMHWSRRFSRGINQAELLAGSIAKNLKLRIHTNLLRCRRKTKKQGTLGPAARSRNLRGAFRIAFGQNISGARILLVDDVMTTGATVGEAARAFRRAGAAGIQVAVVARGVGVE